MEDWVRNNEKYWNALAPKYDSLYDDQWSKLENEYIRSELSWVRHLRTGRMLDLGCGTGLGCELSMSLNPGLEYTGVDIAQDMLDICKDRFPNAIILRTRMSDLSGLSNDYYDAAICLFTAFSFTDNREATLSELARVLKSGGKVLVSCLSKWSLRRLIRMRFGDREFYNTRRNANGKFTYAWVFSKRSLTRHFKAAGFENVRIVGYNAFADVPGLERLPALWGLSRAIARLIPGLSHEWIVTANRK